MCQAAERHAAGSFWQAADWYATPIPSVQISPQLLIALHINCEDRISGVWKAIFVDLPTCTLLA
jgi:hypothetical protein